MEIKILHIDDEDAIIEQVRANVDGEQIKGYSLVVKDSCGFEEGMQKLVQNTYDLIILDLCVGTANEQSDKIGEQVFDEIQKRAFIPVIFFTGLPNYVEGLKSDIVKVVGKLDGFDALLHEIGMVIESGFIKIRDDINDMIREGVRSYFWNFVHKNSALINDLKQDEVSLKYLLLRRLGRSLSYELTRSAVEDPQFKKEQAHPMEFYIYPPVEGEFEAGDIMQSKENGIIYVILTPTCDLVSRSDGSRSAEKVLLVETVNLKETLEYKNMLAKKDEHKNLTDQGKQIAEKDLNQLKNLQGKVKELMKMKNPRYFFLPPTPFIESCLIDFQSKITVDYARLENEFVTIASLDDPLAQAVITSYTRYHSRIGFRDLDIEYVFSKIG